MVAEHLSFGQTVEASSLVFERTRAVTQSGRLSMCTSMRRSSPSHSTPRWSRRCRYPSAFKRSTKRSTSSRRSLGTASTSIPPGPQQPAGLKELEERLRSLEGVEHVGREQQLAGEVFGAARAPFELGRPKAAERIARGAAGREVDGDLLAVGAFDEQPEMRSGEADEAHAAAELESRRRQIEPRLVEQPAAHRSGRGPHARPVVGPRLREHFPQPKDEARPKFDGEGPRGECVQLRALQTSGEHGDVRRCGE